MFPISFVPFRQARKDDQERSLRERRINSRGMEAPIRAGKRKSSEIQRQGGKIGDGIVAMAPRRDGETRRASKPRGGTGRDDTDNSTP